MMKNLLEQEEGGLLQAWMVGSKTILISLYRKKKENFFLNPEVANQWPADKSG